MGSILTETAKTAAWTLAIAAAVVAYVASPDGAKRLASIEAYVASGKPFAQDEAGAAAVAAPSSSYYGEEADLPAGAGGNFFGEASIDGEDVPVVADTGASMVVLPYEVAERIGVVPAQSAFRIPVSTANGPSFMAPITLRYVRLGSVELSNVEAAVALPGAMGPDALLGMTFLGRLRSVQVSDGRLELRN